MRTLAALAAIPLLATSLLTATAAADEDPLTPLAGRWRCTAADGRFTDRAYFLHEVAFGASTGTKEAYGRAELTDGNGIPQTAFERITETGYGATVTEDGYGATFKAPGAAAASSLVFPLRFIGTGPYAATALAYTIDRNALQRTVTRGGATVADERCIRQPDPVQDPTCTGATVPTATINQVTPAYPKKALASRVTGLVHIRVIMDDQSRVVWTDVTDSASPLLTDAALQAARDSTYLTMVVHCAPRPSEEYFTVKFG
jgi:hypothetical protein